MPVDVSRLDEFEAQLYLGPMAPVRSTARTPSAVTAYHLRMTRSGQSVLVTAYKLDKKALTGSIPRPVERRGKGGKFSRAPRRLERPAIAQKY